MSRLKKQKGSGIIDMKITLPIAIAGQNATANAINKGANISYCLGGKDAAPTCRDEKLIAIACNG